MPQICQKPRRVADDVREQPIDGADGVRIERESALGDVLDTGAPHYLGRERRLIDADDPCAQSRQDPAPAAGAAAEIEAHRARPRPLADDGQRLP